MDNNSNNNDNYQQYRPTYTSGQQQSNDAYQSVYQHQQYDGYGFPMQSQGQMQQQPQQVIVVTQTSGMAVTSMIIGILGLLGLHMCGAFLIGIPLGHLALNKIKYSNGRISGRGMAIAGLVMNYIPAIGIGILLLFSVLLRGFTSTLTR